MNTFIVVTTLFGLYIAWASFKKKPEKIITPPQKPKPETEQTPDISPISLPPYMAHRYPLHPNFTGRDTERAMLSDWFDNGNDPLLAVVAMGGMGKSSLAWVWSQDDIIAKDKIPEGFLWWSFYDTETGFENFVDTALKYVSGGEFPVEEDKSLRDKTEALYNILCQHRFLLVLDGVERLLRAYAGQSGPYKEEKVKPGSDACAFFSPQVGQFFQDLANTKSKILLTTRIFPREFVGEDGNSLVGFRSEELSEFSVDNALEFFKRQGLDWHRGEVAQVCQAVGCLPLYVRLFTGRVLKRGKAPSDPAKILKELIVKGQKHHIFEIAYDGLSDNQKTFISRLAAFRSAMDYEVISIFKPANMDEDTFYKILSDLIDRGLLLHDEQKYDLHPSVREYSYRQLKDKKETHLLLAEYFEKIEVPEEPKKLDDLLPLLELYHHILRAGDYDMARDLLYARLREHLFYTFGAYQLYIELLLGLFPDGEDKLPHLKNKSEQAWALNALATNYHCSGQPLRSVPLTELQNKLRKEETDNLSLAIGLGNLAQTHMSLGKLEDAQANLQDKLQLCQNINNKLLGAVGQQELGRLLAYKGNWASAEKKLTLALKTFEGDNALQWLGATWSYYSLVALLQEGCDQALEAAKKARKLADVKHYEIDIVRANWMLGAAYRGLNNLPQAEKHTNEALSRCRKINLVELEADILLELARIRRLQKHKKHSAEALSLANEALRIANRCEYRLQQADIHFFLAQLALDSNDKETAHSEAEIAIERASCGYKPTLDKATQFLEKLQS